MADAKNTAAKKPENTVPSNPTLIEWPSDPTGVTSELKAVLVSTAGRVNGHDDKLEAVIEVLKIGFAHVKARHEANKEQARVDAEWHAEQEAKRVSVQSSAATAKRQD